MSRNLKNVCSIILVMFLFVTVLPFGAGANNASELSQELDLFLFIGQSNMSSRAPIEPSEKGLVDRTFLLNHEDKWEKASFAELPINPTRGIQGYNRYSTVEVLTKLNGFSAGYTFAQEITKAKHDINLGLIYNAKGATKLSEWVKGTENYEEAVRRTKIAMESGKLKAILWHQGEGDNSATGSSTYLSRLNAFVADLRADLGVDESVPFIASKLLPTDKYTNFNTIIPGIVTAVPNADFIDSEGTTDIGDATHTNADGQKLLGTRYAEKVLAMVYNPKVDLGPVPSSEYKVILKEKYLITDVDPMLLGARIFVPLRAIFEGLGATVEWEEETETITGTKNDKVVVLTIGSETATINDTQVTLDAVPVVIDGRTLVPVRFIAESLGATVEWDEPTKTAIIAE